MCLPKTLGPCYALVMASVCQSCISNYHSPCQHVDRLNNILGRVLYSKYSHISTFSGIQGAISRVGYRHFFIILVTTSELIDDNAGKRVQSHTS